METEVHVLSTVICSVLFSMIVAGRLYVTNLRIVWVSSAHFRVNLCKFCFSVIMTCYSNNILCSAIGFKSVTSLSTKKAHSVSDTQLLGMMYSECVL